MFTSSSAKELNHKERAKAAMDDLEEGGRRVKKEMRDTASNVRDDLNFGSMAHAVGEQVGKFVDNASESISSAKESISEATDTATAQIRENPLVATAIAVGIGVVLGALLRRR